MDILYSAFSCCCIQFDNGGAMSGNEILDFYRGTPNDRGVTLKQIWNYSDVELEGHHDFIQWLFPLKKRSQFNPSAPVTDEHVIATFKEDEALRDKMLHSLDVMLKFYGFVRRGEGIEIGENFEVQARNWLNRGNHNFLRMSRILTSLRLHGLKSEAVELMRALQQVYQSHQAEIGERTFSFWQKACESK